MKADDFRKNPLFFVVDGPVSGAVQAHHCDPDVRKCHKAYRGSTEVHKLWWHYFILFTDTDNMGADSFIVLHHIDAVLSHVNFANNLTIFKIKLLLLFTDLQRVTHYCPY